MRKERFLLILSFAAIHIVWGSTYLAIRYAVETIPPLVTAGVRHVIGGGALFAYCWSTGLRPTRRQWRASAILGILFFLIGHGSLHWAELVVPSGIAALLVATEPAWVTALVVFRSERARVSRSAVAGLAIGIAGVAILMGRPSSLIGIREFLGMIAVVAGTFCWAVGMMYSRSAPLHPSPLMSAAMSLLCGGTALLIAAATIGSFEQMHAITLRSVLALTYLIVFGSLTFAGYTWLLTRTSPILIATHAYTNPFIAVILGSLIAGERMTPRIIVAAAAILTSIVLIQRSGDEAPKQTPRVVSFSDPAIPSATLSRAHDRE